MTFVLGQTRRLLEQLTTVRLGFPAVPYDCAYIRDSVELGPDTVATVIQYAKTCDVDRNGTVAIVARRITAQPGFQLQRPGFNLLLVADHIDGNGAVIDLSGTPGPQPPPAAQTGARGHASAIKANVRPASAGLDGAEGGRGRDAGRVTVYARTIRALTILCNGGDGGAGQAGGTGGPGESGSRESPAHHRPESYTADNGSGGTGGRGGTGGAAGRVDVQYVTAEGLSVHNKPGLPGPAGAGGEPGKTSLPPYFDSSARRGGTHGAGDPGPPAEHVEQNVDEGEHNRNVMRAAALAAEWCVYRLRVADYAWRQNRLTDTAAEFQAVLALCAARPRRPPVSTAEIRRLHDTLDEVHRCAHAGRSALAGGLNVLGLPGDYWVTPDFGTYSRLVTSHLTTVQQLLGGSTELLLHASDRAGAADRIATLRGQAMGSLAVTREELAAKDLELQLVRAGLSRAEYAYDQNLRTIEQRQQELAALPFELDGKVLGTVFAVISAVVSLFPPAGGVVAAIGAIGGLYAAFDNAVIKPEVTYEMPPWNADTLQPALPTSWTYRDRDLLDFFDTTDGRFVPKKEVTDLIGGIDRIASGTAVLIDKAKTIADIFRSDKEDKLKAEIKALMVQSVELATKCADEQLRVQQISTERHGIAVRLGQAEEDLARLTREQQRTDERITSLLDPLRTVLQCAREYADIVMRAVFLARRSLDIYQAAAQPSVVAFDYGHVPPDVEEDAFLACQAGMDASGTQLSQLGAALVTSWRSLPVIADMDEKFVSYNARLVGDLQFWHITDAAVVEQFRRTGTATFTITAQEVFAKRADSKVEAVYLALPGAACADPRITCLVEHTGTSWSRTAGGAIAAVTAPPVMVPVTATTDQHELGGVLATLLPHFWGRPPAAIWTVQTDPDATGRASVDLTGLREIQLAVAYRSVLTK